MHYFWSDTIVERSIWVKRVKSMQKLIYFVFLDLRSYFFLLSLSSYLLKKSGSSDFDAHIHNLNSRLIKSVQGLCGILRSSEIDKSVVAVSADPGSHNDITRGLEMKKFRVIKNSCDFTKLGNYGFCSL